MRIYARCSNTDLVLPASSRFGATGKRPTRCGENTVIKTAFVDDLDQCNGNFLIGAPNGSICARTTTTPRSWLRRANWLR